MVMTDEQTCLTKRGYPYKIKSIAKEHTQIYDDDDDDDNDDDDDDEDMCPTKRGSLYKNIAKEHTPGMPHRTSPSWVQN